MKRNRLKTGDALKYGSCGSYLIGPCGTLVGCWLDVSMNKDISYIYPVYNEDTYPSAPRLVLPVEYRSAIR